MTKPNLSVPFLIYADQFYDAFNKLGPDHLHPSVICDDGKMRSFRAHGLRKAALRALAHAGCSDEEMMQVSGHSDARQLREYLNEVDQEELADSATDKLLKKRTQRSPMIKTETSSGKPVR